MKSRTENYFQELCGQKKEKKKERQSVQSLQKKLKTIEIIPGTKKSTY